MKLPLILKKIQLSYNFFLKNYYKNKIEKRLLIKNINNEKIRLIFICHRPSVWGSLKTVFEECIKDSRFEVFIIPIPNKKELPKKGLKHNIFFSEGAETFFENFNCKVINGYDYNTKKWINLKKLKPDYVFYQQPYNICRTPKFRSDSVSKYAKICYVHYGILIFKGEVEKSVYPLDFFKDVSLVFSESQYHKSTLQNLVSQLKIKPNFVLTGYPRFDNLQNYNNCNSIVWNYSEHDKFRILWTPRWCTNENTCNFFDYKDLLLDYCGNSPNIDFVFRPHPQAFVGWNATGELPDLEAKKYKERYNKYNNTSIDYSGEYLPTFYSSDCLITDISSIIPEYFLTGKPIIYCNKTDMFNEFGSRLSKGFYWVENWKELKTTLDMLRSGDDPLRQKRKELIGSEFYIPKEGSGYLIKEAIKKDFLNS